MDVLLNPNMANASISNVTYFLRKLFYVRWLSVASLNLSDIKLMSTPLGGGHIIFAFSAVRRPTWFPDILGNSSYPIFTKFGMQFYWVNSLYGIAFGDDSSKAN